MTVVVILSALMLAAGAVLAAARVERGPSMLDRTIALDVLTSTIVGAVALHAAWTRQIDNVPILVVFALVGFVGSVTIARFAAVEPEGEGRVLTREESDALDAERRADEEAEGSTDEEHYGGPAAGEVSK